MLHLLPLLALASAPGVPGAPAAPPNLVLILADDLGVDLLAAYGEGAAPPCTPNLDQLAAGGLLFRNAWASPVCTPSRAQILTGRYGFRTGGGGNQPGTGLPLDETTLPEMLSGYSSAALGKWGVGSGLGSSHPNDSGFDHYAGGIGGGLSDYFSWSKTTNGTSATSATYATSDTADEAILAAQSLPQPWFLYVSFNAPHTPVHQPPAQLCPAGPCSAGFCAANPAGSGEQVKAMVEALDTEIGRLLAGIEAVDPQALIVFMGDNGTAGFASEPPFAAGHAKGSVYEGGINVPLIVKGPGVVQGECAGLVTSADLAATFTELAGLATGAEDSVSLVPYFANPALALRATVYAETFAPNHGTLPFAQHERAVRDVRYKLIRVTGQPDELYDLAADPFELSDLYPAAVGTPEHDAYLALVQALVELGVEPAPAANYCTAGTSASGCQALLSSAGTPSASAASGFAVSATGVEGRRDGLYYFGTAGRQATPWGNGTSLQCVAPPVQRGGLLQGVGTLGLCDGAFAQDLNALWCPTCPGASKNPGAGATAQAQLWYRDPQNTSNRTTSLSDALEFTLAP